MWSFKLERITDSVEVCINPYRGTNEGEINFARGFCTSPAKGRDFEQKEELEFA